MNVSLNANVANHSKAKTVAKVAAGVVGAAAVASVVAAGVLGKGKIDADKFVGKTKHAKALVAQLGEGYKVIGGKIAKTATQAWGAVKGLADKVFHKTEKAAEVVEAAAEEIAE